MLFNRTVDGLLGDFVKLADRLEAASAYHATAADYTVNEITKLQAEADQNKAEATRAKAISMNIRKLLAA